MKPIYLSAGHSNSDPGATAYGRKEADIAVEFRNMVSFYLTRAGVPHKMDGTGTHNLPLRETVAITRNIDGVEVEFHCNAASSTQATGVETLQQPKNINLGNAICSAISKALGIRNRGAKPENAGQHHRLAFVQAGGIIVELFFITNTSDIRAYEERKWVAASAVADVLIEAAK